MSDPWGEGTPWKNSVAFYTYLRGCLRKAWSRNPVKLEVLKAQRRQIANPNPKGKKATVWGATCAMCGGVFPLKDIQVDHILAAGTLTCKEDIPGFIERLLFVNKDDLRTVCKKCNSILAYQDKHKVSFKEASAVKTAISLIKDKKDKEWLKQRNIVPETSQDKRRKQIIEELLKC